MVDEIFFNKLCQNTKAGSILARVANFCYVDSSVALVTLVIVYALHALVHNTLFRFRLQLSCIKT